MLLINSGKAEADGTVSEEGMFLERILTIDKRKCQEKLGAIGIRD